MSVTTGSTAGRDSSIDVKSMLTWRGADAERIEQVRLNISGARIRAYGRIISGATDEHEAYSVSYELVTNDSGATRRLSVRMLKASGEMSLDISRDHDARWMVQTPDSVVHSDFGGADTVDLWHSPFLKSLVIRRYGLIGGQSRVDIPVVELSLPGCSVDLVEKSYAFDGFGPDGGAATLTSQRGQWSLEVDEFGLVTEFPGIADRI